MSEEFFVKSSGLGDAAEGLDGRTAEFRQILAKLDGLTTSGVIDSAAGGGQAGRVFAQSFLSQAASLSDGAQSLRDAAAAMRDAVQTTAFTFTQAENVATETGAEMGRSFTPGTDGSGTTPPDTRGSKPAV